MQLINPSTLQLDQPRTIATTTLQANQIASLIRFAHALRARSNSIKMLSIRHVLVCFFLLLTQVSGLFILPIIKSLLAAEAPDAIKTQYPSNQCLSINRGELLCCTAALSGGFPAVQALSATVGYSLPANTLNGFLCAPSGTTACPGTQLALCCQVPQVSEIWGLWCQSAL